MKMKIKIDGSTTATQLFALGTMLCSMGGSAAAGNTVAIDKVVDVDVRVDAAAPTEPVKADAAAPGTEPAAEAKTRKPRAKKEDTPPADATPPADPEAAAAAAAQAAIANAQQPAGNEAAPAAAGAFNEAQVQNVATAVARAHGADVVKAKIAELGAVRIATMTPEQLDSLGSYLTGVLDGSIAVPAK